ncbi:MAG: YbgA family protein [Nanoarchaeota archaeon]
MDNFEKPNVFVSKCLGIDSCRWNNVMISFDFLRLLKPFINLYTTCPEFEIKLGVPRDPIRIVLIDEKKELIQPKTKKNLTNDMKKFCNNYLLTLPKMDGFILKHGSPTCGIKDAKIYNSIDRNEILQKDAGFFGEEIMNNFQNCAIIDEGKITNYDLRIDFLTKIFTFANFKKISTINELINFHTKYKFILMSYSPKQLNELGKITAQTQKYEFNILKKLYFKNLFIALNNEITIEKIINVLKHIYGFLKEKLNENEKDYFFELINDYKNNKINLNTIQSVLKSWMINQNEEYLLKQYFFNPFPKELIQIRDSKKSCEKYNN